MNATRLASSSRSSSSVLGKWSTSFPIDEARSELMRLRAERMDLDRQIDGIVRLISLWESSSSIGRIGTIANAALSPQPRKTDAILQILSECRGEPVRLRELRARLVERGWMDNTARAIHALEVAAADLAKRGIIRRRGRGCYALEPATREEAA